MAAHDELALGALRAGDQGCDFFDRLALNVDAIDIFDEVADEHAAGLCRAVCLQLLDPQLAIVGVNQRHAQTRGAKDQPDEFRPARLFAKQTQLSGRALGAREQGRNLGGSAALHRLPIHRQQDVAGADSAASGTWSVRHQTHHLQPRVQVQPKESRAPHPAGPLCHFLPPE